MDDAASRTDDFAGGLPAAAPGSVLAGLVLLARHRRLVFHLTRREIVGRYRGSTFGLLWSLFNPLLLLALYTFVFSTIFRMKWGVGTAGRAEFAIAVFAGMIVHGLFAESANRAPGTIVSNPNYVKKVVFPLEILPWVGTLASLFHTGVSTLVLGAFILVETGHLHATALLAPVVLLPLVLITVGTCWFLASLGVFVRDIGQVIGLATTVLLFLSPVFYPVEAVPPEFRAVVEWNFLTPVIDDFRRVMIEGRAPDWPRWATLCAVGLVVAWAGLRWFERSKKGFADVL